MKTYHEGDQIRFDYTDCNGNVERRRGYFRGLDYGEADGQPSQWWVRTWDFDRESYRSFPLSQIKPETIEVVSRGKLPLPTTFCGIDVIVDNGLAANTWCLKQGITPRRASDLSANVPNSQG